MRRFLQSEFLVKPIARLPERRQSVFVHFLPKPRNKKIAGSVINARLKVWSSKAKTYVGNAKRLKMLEKEHVLRRKATFHCRVMEEKELMYLPQVVAKHPGRPKSILIVSPMSETMSSHQVKSLTSEMRHLQISTLCVRDMHATLDVKDMCETIQVSLPMTLDTKGSRALTTLCLTRVNFGPASVSYLTHGILASVDCKIRHLYCMRTNLGDAGAIQIAQCLSQVNALTRTRFGVATTLLSLWLEQNEIRDEGAAKLGSAIAEHPCLEHVDLSGNLITNKGTEAMSVIVKKNSTLKQLNLSDNCIMDFGNNAFRAVRQHDAVAENLTVISGTRGMPRLACRPRSAMPILMGTAIKKSKASFIASSESSSPRAYVKINKKNTNRDQLLSERDAALEETIALDKRLTIGREDARKHMIQSSFLAHASKSQDGQNALKLIGKMEKTITKLHQLSESLQTVDIYLYIHNDKNDCLARTISCMSSVTNF